MVKDAELCNTTHYNCKNYHQYVPFPTGGATPDEDAFRTREEALLRTLQRLKRGLSKEPLVSDGGGVRTAWEDPSPEETATGPAADAPAIDQALIDEFFLDGSAALGGRTVSGCPIYGPRTAAARREAVHAALAALPDGTAAAPHPPLPVGGAAFSAGAVTPAESREAYRRRLARRYIDGDGAASKAPPSRDAFYLVDLGCVIEQMARWRRHLPMVRPFFAVKCNPDVAVMRLLGALGAGFDCASRAEIELVMQHRLVASPDDVIFANPCKQLADLAAATAHGVGYVVCDNVAELGKVARGMPHAQVLLRIRTDDAAAQCAFSAKFGAGLAEVPALLRAARAWNVDVYGVSFHVGSGNDDPAAYVAAIRDAHVVFGLAAEAGFNCTMLDIGGGFPGDEAGGRFERIAAAIAPVLQVLFPNTTIISEPGRYFTAASHTLAMNVFATRRVRLPEELHQRYARDLKARTGVPLDEPEEFQYYVNDGVYDSFNCILFDHAHPRLVLLDDGDGAAKSDADGDEAPLPLPDTPDEEGGHYDRLHHPRRHPDHGETDDHAGFDDPFVFDVNPTLRDPFLRRRLCPRRPLRLTTIFGPTCDSLDCILKRQLFPEMVIGDWLLAFDMGSYTTAAGCAFNGFKTNRKIYINSAIV